MANRKDRNRRRYQEQSGPFRQGTTIESMPLDIKPGQSLFEAIDDLLSNFYKDWIDYPLPGLDGLTPKEAAKTEEGRDKLEKLFTYMKQLPSNGIEFPFEKIRSQLGLPSENEELADDDIMQLSQIHATPETFDALVKWVEDGGVDHYLLIPPMEYGLLMLSKNEFALFDLKDEETVRFAWHKDGVPYSTFEYNVRTSKMDNILVTEKFEPNEEVYKPFIYIVNAYLGAMGFIVSQIENPDAVEITPQTSQQIIIRLNHQGIEFKDMSDYDTIEAYLKRFSVYTADWELM